MNASEVKGVFAAINKLNKDIRCFNDTLSGGPAAYYLEKLHDYYTGCMTHSKFKEGECVELAKPPDWNKSSGWLHCKHFLVKGAKAEVKEVDFSVKRGYEYLLEFETETWVNNKGEAIPVKSKHAFSFAEEYIQNANS